VSASATTVTHLAPREWEVLELMSQGCSNAGIATRLYLSDKTVEWYVHRIFDTLSVPAGAGFNRRVCAVLCFLAMAEAAPQG
jgi:DNA-binding NarL/FixJ family response regulator